MGQDLTKLEVFAACALIGVSARKAWKRRETGQIVTPKERAELALSYAEAMMEVLTDKVPIRRPLP